MRSFRGMGKALLLSILLMAMTAGVSLVNCRTVYAQEKAEVVTGTVYQFGEKGKYDISSADNSSSTNDGTECFLQEQNTKNCS